jgi:hypothetical protein
MYGDPNTDSDTYCHPNGNTNGDPDTDRHTFAN